GIESGRRTRSACGGTGGVPGVRLRFRGPATRVSSSREDRVSIYARCPLLSHAVDNAIEIKRAARLDEKEIALGAVAQPLGHARVNPGPERLIDLADVHRGSAPNRDISPLTHAAVFLCADMYPAAVSADAEIALVVSKKWVIVRLRAGA